ncbi:hypothetical protein C8R45DRAFT_930281 [Mycena sanguinolenta]|nr:hypothetical protein C8R45DRAFT_930281 [Mycena sanguinolenta]
MSTLPIPAASWPRSCINMPPLYSRGAPKKVTGRSHDVMKFLSHCDKLFTHNNVFDDIDKCPHISEGMKNYSKPNWAILCTDMQHMFDADKDLQRHKLSDLRKLTEKWRKVPIKTMSLWRKWLLLQKQIDQTESNRYLWREIHSHLRHVIENQLLTKDPKRDMTVPFAEDDIIGIVDAKFKYSEDEIDYKKKSKKSKKSKPAPKKTVKCTHETVQLPSPKSSPSPAPAADTTTEVGELVKQLSRMSLDDKDYNYIYYKATRLDPLIVKCIRAPNPLFLPTIFVTIATLYLHQTSSHRTQMEFSHLSHP